MPTCFRDSKQYKLNQIVLQIEKMFMSTEEYGAIIAYAINELKKEKNMFVMSRFFQSLVEIAGQQITNQLTINFFNFVVSFILDFNNLFDPDQIGSKLHPILIHYFNFFQLNILSEKLLNFCFLLLNLIVISQENYCCGGYYDDVCTFLKTKCKIFLCNIFLQSFDPWLQLYAFVALKKVNDNKNIYLLLKSIDYALLKKKTEYFLNMNINEENIFEKIKKTGKNTVLLQLYFCVNLEFGTHVKLNKKDYFKYITVPIEQKTNDHFCQMNPDDKYENIKMDFSNLMVRNDDDLFRTVRSKFSINPGKFYFEVTILTAGKMRIGLAAKQMAIIDTVGNNPFSVGIDGFERCVWMNKKKYHFTKSQSCWLPGDVIGIYFDSYSKTIIFGINNQVVELDGNPFKNNSFKNIDKQALFKNDPFDSFIFASLPCHVAVSLGMFQQCYFNFNCTVIPSEFLNKLEIVGQNVNIQNSLVSFLGGANKVNSFSVFGNLILFVLFDTFYCFYLYRSSNKLSILFNH